MKKLFSWGEKKSNNEVVAVRCRSDVSCLDSTSQSCSCVSERVLGSFPPTTRLCVSQCARECLYVCVLIKTPLSLTPPHHIDYQDPLCVVITVLYPLPLLLQHCLPPRFWIYASPLSEVVFRAGALLQYVRFRRCREAANVNLKIIITGVCWEEFTFSSHARDA